MRRYTIFVLLCFIVYPLAAQGASTDNGYILLVEDRRAYIDLGANSGASPGAIYSVYEKMPDSTQIEVGRIQIVEVFENGAAATIIDQQPGKQIQVANRIVPLRSTATQPLSGPALIASEPFRPPKRTMSKTTAWLVLVSGVALGLGTIYSHERADSAYDLYTLAQTKADADLFEHRTERLDRNSRIFLGTSVVALATASILFWHRDEPPVTITTSRIDGQPYVSMARVEW